MNNRRSLHLLAEAYQQVVEKQVQARLKESPLDFVKNSNIARKLTGRPSQEQDKEGQQKQDRINRYNYEALQTNLAELEKIKTALPTVLSQLQQSQGRDETERDTNRSNTDQKWNKGNYDGKPSGYDLDRAEKSKQSDDFRRRQAGNDAEKTGNQASDANELKDKVDTLIGLLRPIRRNITNSNYSTIQEQNFYQLNQFIKDINDKLMYTRIPGNPRLTAFNTSGL